MARNTKIQLRRGTAAQWTSSGATLAEGEIGYEIDTGRFKIGKTDGSLWSALPYAGGSDLAGGSGIATIFNSSTNTYTLHNSIVPSGSGISLSSTTFSGDGSTTPSGSGWQIGLSNRLQAVSNLNTSGIIVSTNTSGVVTRSLSSGANISISNADGISANPVIGLSASLTGISSISSLEQTSSISGFNITANTGSFEMLLAKSFSFEENITSTGYIKASTLILNATCNAGLISNRCNVEMTALSGLAKTTASGINLIANSFGNNAGTINISGANINVSGQTNFNLTPTVNNTVVSLSGHQHLWTDVTDFGSGVANYVDTSLSAGTGIQLISTTDNLAIALTGQSLALHTFNGTGLIVRTGSSSFSARAIAASGSNILIGNGDGVTNNPSVGLNPNVAISSLGVTNDVGITGNLIVGGNLTVNGDTVVTNVSTVQVEDPVIRIGGTGTLSNSDDKDRGIEFIYQTGNGVSITGFFGFDYSTSAFTLLTNTNNSNEIYTGGTSGLLNVGGLFSSGRVSGTVLTSTTEQGGVSPIVVSSSGLVSNLNADYLDGQHGSHYLNSANLTGTINNSVLPVASTSNSGIVRFDSSNFIFNTNGIVSSKDTVYTTGVQTVSGVKTFENRPVLNSGLSIKNSATTVVSGFAVFSGDPTAGTAFTVDYRSIGNIRSDLGTSTNTANRLVLRDSNGDFASRYISVTGISGVQTVGSMTSVYTSTSISGLNNTTYLANFIIDGGTP